MDIIRFVSLFEGKFINSPIMHLAGIPPLNRLARKLLDPCPRVLGMASYKKLLLLRQVVSLLPGDSSECYLEVGTYQGKSLVAALRGNRGRLAVACDDFSQFDADGSNRTTLKLNLQAYGLSDQVKFYDTDFRKLFAKWHDEALPKIGAYFYDGAHDRLSQYDAIRLVEPLLADQAVVIVDDWRFAEDSGSYAEEGTKMAVTESSNLWTVLRILPARYNGDRDQWWNGLGILGFARRPRAQ